jgi:excisionase family DNA binding protein
MNIPLEKQVLDLANAAIFLHLPRRKVRALAETGELRGRKVGRDWRFLKTELENWLRGDLDPTQALLQQAGLFKNSEVFPEVVEAIQKARQRSKYEESAS